MEHRYATRKDLQLAVVVSLPRLGLVRGYTTDVSMGGMFVETDCVSMPVNAVVSVSFQPGDENPLVCFKARAMVVHQRGGGFGLMFDELDSHCARALRGLMVGTGEEPGKRESTEVEPAPKWATG